jgi:hypothetical protein
VAGLVRRIHIGPVSQQKFEIRRSSIHGCLHEQRVSVCIAAVRVNSRRNRNSELGRITVPQGLEQGPLVMGDGLTSHPPDRRDSSNSSRIPSCMCPQ